MQFKPGDIVEYIDSDGDRSVHYISLYRDDKDKYALCRNSCEVGIIGKEFKSDKLVFESSLRLVKAIPDALNCSKCEKEFKPSKFFFTEHQRSIREYGMCFNCRRWHLGHAGYGE